VVRIEVEGNRSSDTRLITRTSGLTIGDPATRDAIRTAVRSLWALGLFDSIAVRDWPEGENGRGLAIAVHENPRLGLISWEGNNKLGDEDLKGKIDLRPGQILTERKLFEAIRGIEAAYRDEGYAAVEVEARRAPSETGSIDLTFAIEEHGRVSIAAVEFEGNENFPDDKLRGEAALKKNSLFRRKRYTAERVREDRERLEQFYQNNGFKDAVVAELPPVSSEDGRKITLRWQVTEGPLYRFGSVDWSGNTAVPTEALRAASAIIPGAPYSRARLDATTGSAYELYTEKGYLLELAVVPEMRTAGDSVHVQYRIEEGRPSQVREVSILGNTRTKERVIRREIDLIPGQLMRRSVLLRSQRDVFALGFFEDVQLDYEPAGIGSDVNVAFVVKEKSSGTATAGAGYSSDTGLTGFVQFGHNNLFGNGQAVQLQLERGSRRRTYDISFTEPWMLGTPVSFGIHVYDTVNERDLYSARERGAGFNLGRPWFFKTPDYSRVFLGYALESVRYSDLEDLDEASREILRSSNGTVSRLTLSFSRNSTDNPFYPTSGSRSLARLELAGGALGGEIDYFKPELDHRLYFIPFWKPAVMVRQKLSMLGTYVRGGVVPGSETFRLGGTRTDYLRGYDDYWIVPEENIHTVNGSEVRFPGGKFAYTFTTEYQFPLFNPVRGLLFLDAGNTWNSARDFSLGDLRKGAGAGVRLEIPMLGVVGLDYAYGLDRGKWQAHFIIGPAF